MFSTPRYVESSEEDYDTDELPLQGSTSYNPVNYMPSTNTIMNGFTRVQQSILKLSPSRIGAMQTSLATVPEASDEGSDRQSVSTTTTDTAVDTRSASKFTEHSIQEVRLLRPPEQVQDDPFIDTSMTRDPRSIAYRAASAAFVDVNAAVTPPRPFSQFSNGSGVYASGASRSPTPARDSSIYRRVYDEEQPPLEEDDEEVDEDEEEEVDEDLVDQYLQPYAIRDPEKYSLSSSNSSTLDGYAATPLTTRHFGPAPAGRVHRRNKMMFKKAVRLTNGNLVVDLDPPPKLIKVLPMIGGVQHEERSEMTKTRYTAVTGDPDDFARQGFFLRQNELGRTTELFIVITMYNVRATERKRPPYSRLSRKMKCFSAELYTA